MEMLIVLEGYCELQKYTCSQFLCLSTPKPLMYLHYFLIPKKTEELDFTPCSVSQRLPTPWGGRNADS